MSLHLLSPSPRKKHDSVHIVPTTNILSHHNNHASPEIDSTTTDVTTKHETHELLPALLTSPTRAPPHSMEFAIPDPRVIRYSYLSYRDFRIRARSSVYSLEQTLPGILHACYDSRKEALKRYRLAFTIELGKPVYFDFERDTLEFGDFDALEAFSKRNTKFNGCKMEADSVRTLAITLEPRLDREHFKLICSNFGRLQELNIRERNENWRNQGYWWSGSTGSPGRWISEVPPLKVVESEEIATYTPLMGLLANIRWLIEARTHEIKKWKPPKVTTGSEQRWQMEMEKNGNLQVEGDGMDLDAGGEKLR